jgi:hypothetical protein
MSLIPELDRLRQEFETSLSYIVRSCLKKREKERKRERRKRGFSYTISPQQIVAYNYVAI